MAGDYIPRRESAALQWMQAFAGGIAANPALYGLTAPEAAAIQAAVNAFDTAFSIANTPRTRTAVTVSEKNTARRAAEQICRQFAIQLKHHDGVSDASKIAIGVRPMNRGRQPINVPTTSPLVSVIAATQGAHTLRYADSLTPDSRAKPYGAANLQLFVVIGDEEARDPEQAKFVGAFTTNPIGVDFAAADDGKQATYFARWSSRRGDVGPWSIPIRMRIAA